MNSKEFFLELQKTFDVNQEEKDKGACQKALHALKFRRFNQPIIHMQHIENNPGSQVNDKELSTRRLHK